MSMQYLLLFHFQDIPLFGVLTHKDNNITKDEAFRNLEDNFRRSLGINRRRYLLCSNYCDDNDDIKWEDGIPKPDVEFPVIDFITEVKIFVIFF